MENVRQEESRDLEVIIGTTQSQCPSNKRKFLEYHSKGYSAIKLNQECMKQLSDGLVIKTLSNMTKYSIEANKKGSTFVFQKPGKRPAAPVLSKTRYSENNQ